MSTKTVTSTEVQNNFGQIIDAVAQEHTRYIIINAATSPRQS